MMEWLHINESSPGKDAIIIKMIRMAHHSTQLSFASNLSSKFVESEHIASKQPGKQQQWPKRNPS